MKNRIPTYPGRVKMTLPDGTVQYVTLERADEPTEPGTPLNKATLLTDETAELLGLSSGDATVNEGLRFLAGRPARGPYASDLYLFLSGQHPYLNAGPYDQYADARLEASAQTAKDSIIAGASDDAKQDAFTAAYEALRSSMSRNISLTGNPQTITVYDNP